MPILIVPSIEEVKNRERFDKSEADEIVRKISDGFYYGGVLIRIGSVTGPLITKTNFASYAQNLYHCVTSN